ncbi:hypothetical protein Taro_004089 [Colocasia esculenta]|uniref:Uncharacterized protein n=1 Tax=Colocasia esculenta TaxID=4460 RepID=A0A843TQL6_COLES|nr:hypothetical protein [Colocasia esculenta]
MEKEVHILKKPQAQKIRLACRQHQVSCRQPRIPVSNMVLKASFQ